MVIGQVEEQCGYASVEYGALFVIISGIYMTLEWCVDNWDMAVKVEQLHDQLICSATTVKTLNVGGRTMLQQDGNFMNELAFANLFHENVSAWVHPL